MAAGRRLQEGGYVLVQVKVLMLFAKHRGTFTRYCGISIFSWTSGYWYPADWSNVQEISLDNSVC